ncbi:amino acid adenylation domain-containing protein [Catenulispora pinisilvae]|uniref:amino acid adenylation domain-containing protein n=1 Tax=Catenulispora pinisilvae TaxID=2705253 RepID=UPI001892262E|nr:amino acid adenylation domain-containing protein [Catenulispora pinisilvae]
MADSGRPGLVPAGAQTVLDLIDARVRDQPDATAIRTPHRTLTYAETARATSRLADRLRRRGVGPETIVAVHLPRGLDALIGMLAVLRCGAAFLPLAVEDPGRRKQEVLADAGCLLTLVEAPVDWTSQVELVVDPEPADRLGDRGGDASELPSPAEPRPQELAYVITTSGSTGRPKVVGIPHEGILNLVVASILELDLIRPDDTILWTTTLTADITVHDCLMALCCGATVAIPDRSELPIGRIAATARQLAASIVDLPAAVLGPYGRSLVPRLAEAGVRLLFTGGSQLDGDGFADHASLVVANGYGPTEATVAVTWYRCTDKTPAWVPIGSAFRGVRLYVLDEELTPAPQGQPGQLYVAGVCLARGYLGLPGRTAESFVPDPFAPTPGERMYATGDLVQQNEDGDLIYRGRIDSQVKISGYRVELGEVEHAVRDCPGVVDATALLRADAPGGAAIIAFVVGDSGLGAVVGDRLRERLPAHMVPRHVVWLPELPINALGKVDRVALAAMAIG